MDNAVVNWFRTASLGWPLIFFSIALYLSGLGYWGYENRGGLAAFVADLGAAGTDLEALEATLRSDPGGVASLWSHATTAVLGDPTATASLLFAGGIVLMPTVFFVVIRMTRQHYGWDPSYLYVAAVTAPAACVAATAALGTIPLAAELLGYALAPVLSVAGLVSRGYLWPRVRSRLD